MARIATGLGEAGVVAGQRVMIALPNRLEFVTAYLGVLRAQAVAVPVNPRSTVDELARMIADSGARLVVADATVGPCAPLDVVRRPGRRDRDVDADLSSGPRAGGRRRRRGAGHGELPSTGSGRAEPRAVPPLQDPEKLAALLYTSGTSGRPRAAMLTHRALLANLEPGGRRSSRR